MVSHTTQIKLIFQCSTEKLAEIIVKTLEPENKLIDDSTEINMTQEGKEINIEINSSASIPSLRYTIDDILHTLSTIEKVHETIERNSV